MPIYPGKSSRLNRFCVRYDWWRRLQPTSSVSQEWNISHRVTFHPKSHYSSSKISIHGNFHVTYITRLHLVNQFSDTLDHIEYIVFLIFPAYFNPRMINIVSITIKSFVWMVVCQLSIITCKTWCVYPLWANDTITRHVCIGLGNRLSIWKMDLKIIRFRFIMRFPGTNMLNIKHNGTAVNITWKHKDYPSVMEPTFSKF